MNCKLCLKYLDDYREGNMPAGTSDQVKTHLESCPACAESYRLLTHAYQVIDEEKEIQSNPFLSTRIMAQIGNIELPDEHTQLVPVYRKVLQPVLIAFSLAFAVFTGILAGNIYMPEQSRPDLPVELIYMDDAYLESMNLLSKD